MSTHRGRDVRGRKSRKAGGGVRKAGNGARKGPNGVAEMDLRGLRESLGKTQEEIAHLAEITQSQLSKIERRDDHLISTLRRYVRALGGDIDVVAVVGEKRVSLRGV